MKRNAKQARIDLGAASTETKGAWVGRDDMQGSLYIRTGLTQD